MDSVLSNQMKYSSKKIVVAVALSTLSNFKGMLCNFLNVQIIAPLLAYCTITITSKSFVDNVNTMALFV